MHWVGSYELNAETPEGKAGLHGLFVYTYDSEIVYIGKASGKYHLFQESKWRYKALNKALIELKILRDPLDRDTMDKVAKEHCRKYVGVLLDETKLPYLDSAENLLIFNKQPPGNTLLRAAYRGARPFRLINKGEKSILAVLNLPDYLYVDLPEIAHKAVTLQ